MRVGFGTRSGGIAHLHAADDNTIRRAQWFLMSLPMSHANVGGDAQDGVTVVATGEAARRS